MNIRPATPADLDAIREIDSVIESSQYLHVDRAGEGLAARWSLERRPLREKLIEPNRLADETDFLLRQIVSGNDEGFVRVAEHEGEVRALLLAQARPERGTLEVLDLRVDYDFRRQGLATVLLFAAIEQAREQELRAVAAETRTNNMPAADLLEKLGFELSGLDVRRYSNHDLVKEAATLHWHYETA